MYDRIRDHEEAWLSAESYADLCDLNIRFLDRRLLVHPLQAGTAGPDPETDLIRLIELNARGFFTTWSQPGLFTASSLRTGKRIQRAAVCGFLDRVVHPDGVRVVTHFKRNRRIPVTKVRNKPRTWLGYADVPAMFAGYINPAALQELRGKLTIDFYDPVWGRNSRLWREVLRVL